MANLHKCKRDREDSDQELFRQLVEPISNCLNKAEKLWEEEENCTYKLVISPLH